MARNGRNTVIYKGTFVSNQSLQHYKYVCLERKLPNFGRLDLILSKQPFQYTKKIFQTKGKKLRDSYLVHFYEDGTKF